MADRISFRSSTDAAGFTMLSNLVLLDTNLSDGAKVTYLILLHHARQAGSCFPGQEKLAQERGISSRSIRTHMAELAACGMVTIEVRGNNRTNLYWIESLESAYETDRKDSSTRIPDRKKSSVPDRKKSSHPKDSLEEDEVKEESTTLNVGGSRLKNLRDTYIADVMKLTGDNQSERRFAQLFGICVQKATLDIWEEACRSTRKALRRTDMRPGKPGAYFCSVLAALLLERGVVVPVGSKSEREEVKSAMSEIQA